VEIEASPVETIVASDVAVVATPEPEAVVAEIVDDPGPESELEVERVPEIEIVNEMAQAEEAASPAPMQEPDLAADAAIDPQPLAEVQVPEDAASAEREPEYEALAAEEVLEPAEVPEPMIETPSALAEQKPATPELVTPAVQVQEPLVEPAIEDSFEQVTESHLTVENVSVDEAAPQAESAISEDPASESASPVPYEMVDPAMQAVEDEIEEPVEVAAASEEVDPNAEAIVAQDAERAEGQAVEQSEIIDHIPNQIPSQITNEFVNQVVEQPMELNQPNPEPVAEHEDSTETPSPLPAAEEPANPLEATSDDATAADEPAAPAVVAVAAQHPSKPFIKLEAREGEANPSPFSVIVSQVYDGPLDLLLDLIRKQDIDIYDIPIARITAQFLAYVNQLKASDVDVAGEFIYTASLLIHIKSKMLLPRAPSGPDDAAEDPRRELVERLLEHERFKNAAQMLQQKQMLEAATWTNPGVRDFKEDVGAEPEIAADTVDLVRVFREILERARNRPVLNVEEDSVTVGQMIQFLSRRLSMEDKPVALRKLLSHSRSERALIAMFLALLELVRLQAILLRQDLAFSEIFIKKHSNFESVMTEGVAQDDWK